MTSGMEDLEMANNNWLTDDPETNYKNAVWLIYFEEFDTAKELLKVNVEKYEHSDSKELLESFGQLDEYKSTLKYVINDFGNGNYSKVVKQLKPYIDSGLITKTAVTVYVIALTKLGKHKEVEEISTKLSNVGISIDEWIQKKSHTGYNFRRGVTTFVIIVVFLVGLFIGFGSNLDNFRDVKEKNDDENRTTLSSESATDTLVTSTNNINSDAQSSNFENGETENETGVTTVDVTDTTNTSSNEVIVSEDTSEYKLLQELKSGLDEIIYKFALEDFKKGDYEKAYFLFKSYFDYSRHSYLDQHALYYLAQSAEMIKSDDAIDIYNSYIEKSLNGEYATPVYFESAVYKCISLNVQRGMNEEAKKYVKLLPENSVYRNTLVVKNLER